MPVEHVAHAVTIHHQRAAAYKTFRDYHAGRHELAFASDHFKAEQGRRFQALRENLCPAVVSAYTDRLRISTWGTPDADQLADQLGLTRLVADTLTEMVRCGDAYVLTWYGRDGQPKPRMHRADQIVPHVDDLDPDRLDRATKLWTADGHGRANVYYADRVERWRTRHPLTDGTGLPEEPEAWVPHRDDDGGDTLRHGFGAVPVCWFKLDADDPTAYGRSALADVIPLQDALNKVLADLLVLSETYSRPFWYLLNYQPTATNPLDRARQWSDAIAQLGQQKFDGAKQRIFTHDGPGPFGQLTPPNLVPLLEESTALRDKIAAVKGIPAYYFTQSSGQVPSGESLRVLTSRLVAGVRAIQDVTGPVWRGVAELLGMDGIDVQWDDPMPMDEAERVDNALKLKSLGIALEDVVTYLDLPDAEGVLARAAAANAASADAVGRALAAGQIPARY